MRNAQTNIVPIMSGIGIYLPRNIVLSRDLDAKLGLRSGWLERNCGVAQRHVVSGDETQEIVRRQVS